MGIKHEDELDQALAEMEAAALKQSSLNELDDISTEPETSSKANTATNKEISAPSPIKEDKTASNPVRFKQIGGHFHVDVHRAIALIGVNEDRTIQSLAAEAFADLLRKRGCDKAILELTKLTRPTKA